MSDRGVVLRLKPCRRPLSFEEVSGGGGGARRAERGREGGVVRREWPGVGGVKRQLLSLWLLVALVIT